MKYPRIECVTDRESLLSKAIRWFSDEDFSHSYINEDGKTVFEAFLRVTERSLSIYRDEEDYWAAWEITKASKKQVEDAVAGMKKVLLGQPYAFGQLIGVAFVELMRKCGIRRNNPFRRRVVCSELVWELIWLLGGEYRRRLEKAFPFKDVFNPGDLAKFCAAHKDLFRETTKDA